MRLYEINAALEELLSNVDEETGEVMIDLDQFDELLMAREEKLEGIALKIKDLDADATAIRAEEVSLAERRRRCEKHRDSLKRFLQSELHGEKMSTPRVAISYRATKAVEIDESFWRAENEPYFRLVAPEADKKAIRAALELGIVVPGATLCDRTSMTIR